MLIICTVVQRWDVLEACYSDEGILPVDGSEAVAAGDGDVPELPQLCAVCGGADGVAVRVEEHATDDGAAPAAPGRSALRLPSMAP